MRKENIEIGFKDLSPFLKVCMLGGLLYVTLFVIGFVIGFVSAI